MYKINKKTGWYTYQEIGQTNPLRWTVLFKEEDESYTEQTGLFKCKDFFNDLVATYQEQYFTVHGFNNKIKLNDDGVHVYLSKLNHLDNLVHNLRSINAVAVGLHGFDPVALNPGNSDTEALLFIPRTFFSKTYYISMLIWLIRIAHQEDKHDTFDSLVSSKITADDCPLSQYKGEALADPFKLPHESLVNRVWYLHTKEDYKDITGHNIHNNGVYDWWYKAYCYRLLKAPVVEQPKRSNNGWYAIKGGIIHKPPLTGLHQSTNTTSGWTIIDDMTTPETVAF